MNKYRKFTLNDMNIPIVFFSFWKLFWRWRCGVEVRSYACKDNRRQRGIPEVYEIGNDY